MKADLIREIQKLKEERNALLLAHYYEDGDIQDIADHVGDSLALAQWGKASNKPVVLLAGVTFMGESVKILSPEKTVLVPDMNAGCSLVDHSPFDRYSAWKAKHPGAVMVTYVNSSALVKSISDIIITSSNAEKIISAIPKDKEILFGPDRHLGHYISKKLNREMNLWPGSCEVHVLFSARKLFELKSEHPKALVLAHPECTEGVLKYADYIGSTTALLNEVKSNPALEFIVATEAGILHQMQKARPEVKLYQAPAEGSCACNECPYMKLNTLEKIRNALRDMKPEMHVPEDIRKAAMKPLERMLLLSSDKKATWSDAMAL